MSTNAQDERMNSAGQIDAGMLQTDSPFQQAAWIGVLSAGKPLAIGL